MVKRVALSSARLVAAVLVFSMIILLVGVAQQSVRANPITYLPPEITLESPLPSGSYNASSIPIIVAVTVYGYTYLDIERISWLSYSIDGQLNVSMAIAYPSSYAPGYNATGLSYLSSLSNGPHSLQIEGATTYSASFQKSVNFTVDIISNSGIAADSWKTVAPLPTARTGLGLAMVDGKIYALGGRSSNKIFDLNEVYYPTADTWFSKAPMPTPNSNFGTVVYQNKIYCLGGGNGTNQVYDPATNTWENKAFMPTPRTQLEANLVGDKIFLIGGLLPSTNSTSTPSGPNISNLTEAYDIQSDTWASLTPMLIPVFNYASAVVNGKIYVISGYYERGYSERVQVYDPASNTWSLAAPIPIPVSESAAGVTTGTYVPQRVFVIGGRNLVSNASLPSQVYDPKSDSWAFGAPMPTLRQGLAVAVADDVMYAVGGVSFDPSNFTFYNLNEQYTPLGYKIANPATSSPKS